jgi:hypothetical protein
LAINPRSYILSFFPFNFFLWLVFSSNKVGCILTSTSLDPRHQTLNLIYVNILTKHVKFSFQLFTHGNPLWVHSISIDKTNSHDNIFRVCWLTCNKHVLWKNLLWQPVLATIYNITFNYILGVTIFHVYMNVVILI